MYKTSNIFCGKKRELQLHNIQQKPLSSISRNGSCILLSSKQQAKCKKNNYNTSVEQKKPWRFSGAPETKSQKKNQPLQFSMGPKCKFWAMTSVQWSYQKGGERAKTQAYVKQAAESPRDNQKACRMILIKERGSQGTPFSEESIKAMSLQRLRLMTFREIGVHKYRQNCKNDYISSSICKGISPTYLLQLRVKNHSKQLSSLTPDSHLSQCKHLCNNIFPSPAEDHITASTVLKSKGVFWQVCFHRKTWC